jgi:hypothetical protein
MMGGLAHASGVFFLHPRGVARSNDEDIRFSDSQAAAGCLPIVLIHLISFTDGEKLARDATETRQIISKVDSQ